jgi:hypothetical protein
MKLWMLVTFGVVIAPLAFIEACSSDNSGPQKLDASANDSSMPAPDTGGSDGAVDRVNTGNDAGDTGVNQGETGSDAVGEAEAGLVLQDAQLPPGPPPAGQLLLTASGESLALLGYNFPAASPTDPVFADGWEVRFEHFIATFDQVRLWQNPETKTTDQSQVGTLVAELNGPWAVDMSQNHAAWPYIDGKEPGERAVAFAVIPNQNKNGNQPLPTDGTRLAVGFSEVVATPSALNVNLGPDGLGFYAKMIQEGCVALYVGQATWLGDQPPGRCTAATPVDAGAEGGVSGGTGLEPEFARIPPKVNFELCFKPRAPLSAGALETSYINCQNFESGMPGVNGEKFLRGVAFKTNAPTIGEVTFHTDHPFWESTVHDTPAHFDQFAARATGGDGGIPTVHMEDTIGVDYTGFTDKQGNAVPWRICDPNYNNPNGGGRVGQMNFDQAMVSHCANGDSGTGLCDYYDFSKYNQSTQGHWNGAEGLCYVQRNYPSPP